jgi:hypothetical protein
MSEKKSVMLIGLKPTVIDFSIKHLPRGQVGVCSLGAAQ